VGEREGVSFWIVASALCVCGVNECVCTEGDREREREGERGGGGGETEIIFIQVHVCVYVCIRTQLQIDIYTYVGFFGNVCRFMDYVFHMGKHMPRVVLCTQVGIFAQCIFT